MEPGPETIPDLSQVRGQEAAKRALEIAAAGRHDLLLVGSMGTGKSLLARCLPGLLPPPTDTDRDAIQEIHERGGQEPPPPQPVRMPDITMRATDLLGIDGRPGEADLARGGVLILDDLTAFRPRTLRAVECLLDEHQDQESAPLLVATLRSCPCGHRGDRARECTCPPSAMDRYWSRVEAVADRLELHIELPPVTLGELCARPVEMVARRVVEARRVQENRRADGPLPTPETLSGPYQLDRPSHQLLEVSFQRIALSLRGLRAVLRVARTIADLAGRPTIGASHLAEALQYRSRLAGEDEEP